MCQDPTPPGVVSRDELDRLVALFGQFEGAARPLSRACHEAEAEFTALVEQIYSQKVKPVCESVPLSRFRSYVRLQCRRRISKQGPPFPCA